MMFFYLSKWEASHNNRLDFKIHKKMLRIFKSKLSVHGYCRGFEGARDILRVKKEFYGIETWDLTQTH